jgi:riboflavin kinase/FMN adenylyltransferase
MRIIDTLAAAQTAQPSLVTVGSYDGVHIGHQRLLARMRQTARQLNCAAVVVTFHPRPQAVLSPHKSTLDLITPDEKAELLAQLGMDLTVMLRFGHQMAHIPARQFVADLVAHLHMHEMWIGMGFSLGRNREGDVPTLRRLGEEMGFVVRVVDPVICDGAMVSSTRIRHLLMDGRIRQVTPLLGRYASLSGEVVHGAERGRRIGFPTANIAVPPQLVLPPNGVYACFACVGGQRRPAVTNIGIRPTFTDPERTVEAHVLDFSGDLYGQRLRLELVEFLRPETRFDTIAGLVAQISADAETARRLLSEEQAESPCLGMILRVPGLSQACDPSPEPAGEP